MAYLLFAEYVVSSCEDVAPAGQQPVGALRVESVSGAGVFGVADDDVDLFFASETPELSGNISDGFRPDDVAERQQIDAVFCRRRGKRQKLLPARVQTVDRAHVLRGLPPSAPPSAPARARRR